MKNSTNSLYTTDLPKTWFVKDRPDSRKYLSSDEDKSHRESLLFHIAQGDYFSTLATVFRFLEETIHDEKTTSEMRQKQLRTIEIIMSDLLYLNDNYDLISKSNKTKT